MILRNHTHSKCRTRSSATEEKVMEELVFGAGRTRTVCTSSGGKEDWLEVEFVPRRGILILERNGERRVAILGKPTTKDWSCYELERFDPLQVTSDEGTLEHGTH